MPEFGYRVSIAPSSCKLQWTGGEALRSIAALWIVVAALAALAPEVRAVTFQDQARRLQLIYSFLLDFRPAQAPLLPSEYTFEIAAELIPNPSVDNRVGGKNEPVDPPPVIPRARARLISPSGWMVGGSYGPPIEFADFSAEWIAVEGGFRFELGPVISEARGFFISGDVEGPITEPGTKDDFSFENHGADVRAGISLSSLTVYGGLGLGRTSSELTITSDGSTISVDTDYSYLLAGASWELDPLLLSFEQSRTEGFLNHVTLSAAYRF